MGNEWGCSRGERLNGCLEFNVRFKGQKKTRTLRKCVGHDSKKTRSRTDRQSGPLCYRAQNLPSYGREEPAPFQTDQGTRLRTLK